MFLIGHSYSALQLLSQHKHIDLKASPIQTSDTFKMNYIRLGQSLQYTTLCCCFFKTNNFTESFLDIIGTNEVKFQIKGGSWIC